MRKSALALGLGIAAAGTVWLGSSPDPGPAPGPPRPWVRPQAAAAPPALTRDLFRYADEKPLPPPLPAPAPRLVAEPPPPPPPPIRLLGIVRIGGSLRAALSVEGETVTLAEGESVPGCRVIAISADAVRVLRDGEELRLAR